MHALEALPIVRDQKVVKIVSEKELSYARFHDISGKLVKEVDIQGALRKELDVSGLDNGIYILHLVTKTGDMSARKFIKE